MISLQLIRENPDLVIESLTKRGETLNVLAEIQDHDAGHRRILREVEILRARRNEASRQLGPMKEKSADLLEEMRGLGVHLESLETEEKSMDSHIRELLLTLPNLVDPSVPEGNSAEDNKVVRQWGQPKELPFQPRPHWEIGEKLGILDFERGQKLSGSRFYVMRGAGARLQRALIQWMLDVHTGDHGYTEIYPPFVVRGVCLEGTGSLPKFGDNLYRDIEEDLWMVPTAEVPLTNLHRDELLPPGSLPIRYVAYTPCFRREKMSAGKDVRGIKRGHQFDKVEMYKFVEPATSNDELEKLTDNAEDMLRRLEIPHRVLQLCSGDLGFAAAKTYDVEAWAPGCNEWLEVSSCSNCADFQARRANVRFRPAPGARPEFAHTLNGSGLGLPRTVIAVLENYQQADGSVVVPEVLRPYMGGMEVIKG